jgi:hypothetical protein
MMRWLATILFALAALTLSARHGTADETTEHYYTIEIAQVFITPIGPQSSLNRLKNEIRERIHFEAAKREHSLSEEDLNTLSQRIAASVTNASTAMDEATICINRRRICVLIRW